MLTKQNLLFEIAQMLKLETSNKVLIAKDKIKFILPNKQCIYINATKLK